MTAKELIITVWEEGGGSVKEMSVLCSPYDGSSLLCGLRFVRLWCSRFVRLWCSRFVRLWCSILPLWSQDVFVIVEIERTKVKLNEQLCSG